MVLFTTFTVLFTTFMVLFTTFRVLFTTCTVLLTTLTVLFRTFTVLFTTFTVLLTTFTVCFSTFSTFLGRVSYGGQTRHCVHRIWCVPRPIWIFCNDRLHASWEYGYSKVSFSVIIKKISTLNALNAFYRERIIENRNYA